MRFFPGLGIIEHNAQNNKAYNRNKSRNWKREMHVTSSGNFSFANNCKYCERQKACNIKGFGDRLQIDASKLQVFWAPFGLM